MEWRVMGETVRLEMKMSKDLYDRLEQIAESEGTNRGELMRKATTLFLFAQDAKKQGSSIASVKDGKIVTQVIGL
jgi:metal-responsive CopG/Arc/MetJ family transcriptional regulator